MRLPEFLQAILLAIAVGAPLLALFPVLASAGFDIPAQLAYGQTAAAYVVAIPAAGLGLYTVTQVRLARSSLEGDIHDRTERQKTRASARAAEEREVLMALLGELLWNLKIASQHEQGFWVQPLARDPSIWLFRFATYRTVLAGPLWQLPRDTPVWVPVVKAYGALEALSLEMNPFDWRAWLGWLAATAVAVGPRYWRVLWTIGLGAYVLALFASAWRVRRNGKVTQVREMLGEAAAVVFFEASEHRAVSLNDIEPSLRPALKRVMQAHGITPSDG